MKTENRQRGEMQGGNETEIQKKRQKNKRTQRQKVEPGFA